MKREPSKRIHWKALLVIAAAGLLFRPAPARASVSGGLVPSGLKCEYRTEPLGIDSPAPRLGWIVESGLRDQAQSAYQVLPDGTGPGSYDISPALFGKKGSEPIREAIISHSENGTFAIRRGAWKLVVDNKTSGGRMTPAGKSPGRERRANFTTWPTIRTNRTTSRRSGVTSSNGSPPFWRNISPRGGARRAAAARGRDPLTRKTTRREPC